MDLVLYPPDDERENERLIGQLKIITAHNSNGDLRFIEQVFVERFNIMVALRSLP
jgi:hypothetical protein